MLLQSAPDWCFLKPPTDPATYYRGLRAIGFVAAELVPPERIPLAQAAGLNILSLFGHSQSAGLNRPDHHAAAFAALRPIIALASAHHIPHVLCFSGNRYGEPDSVGIQHCITALRTLAPEAARAGVILTLEVFNKFDHPNYQADSSAYAFQVVRSVNSPHVKVLFDIYHMHRMGEPVTEVILQNLPLIAHLHIAGSPNRDFPGPVMRASCPQFRGRPARAGDHSTEGASPSIPAPQPAAPSEQLIDYATLVRQVHAAGYTGYWGHEYKPKSDSLKELAQSFALFSSYIA